jgi:hypothetical protein
MSFLTLDFPELRQQSTWLYELGPAQNRVAETPGTIITDATRPSRSFRKGTWSKTSMIASAASSVLAFLILNVTSAAFPVVNSIQLAYSRE